jgi:hypothetical protein
VTVFHSTQWQLADITPFGALNRNSGNAHSRARFPSGRNDGAAVSAARGGDTCESPAAAGSTPAKAVPAPASPEHRIAAITSFRIIDTSFVM